LFLWQIYSGRYAAFLSEWPSCTEDMTKNTVACFYWDMVLASHKTGLQVLQGNIEIPLPA